MDLSILINSSSFSCCLLDLKLSLSLFSLADTTDSWPSIKFDLFAMCVCVWIQVWIEHLTNSFVLFVLMYIAIGLILSYFSLVFSTVTLAQTKWNKLVGGVRRKRVSKTSVRRRRNKSAKAEQQLLLLSEHWEGNERQHHTHTDQQQQHSTRCFRTLARTSLINDEQSLE